ncbi:cupin domain-containing protein [Colwellia hornerae]|uniref:Cupin domain-containing protein n=1 Tax=Colwellia hornerae TaxID=89402 RepID=A0A5C6QET8_9GAMM|nr:cupin domain-containing protein [Colwellia hornerae]TWX52283.1 cupin domain-containing protein [Colwellia hornerae]TWX57842.1 cupin domain-containing protein [Colwellia hornerae]TWX67544.1 cupin domain-containing protein [Colwellia hornerae]
MQKIHWGELTPEQFLKEYWQKKPLLIKGAFKDFTDPIDANELAGLAMESEIESRIIARMNGEWQVEQGPFESFDKFGEQDWTLLVQAVNNWSRDTQSLLAAVDFIPQWRIDDVMVSFSTPNGGVGAHLDQYDVFIVQGEGKRRWQVGAPDSSLKQLLPHPDLKQVSSFVAVIDEVTEAGDLLYIPPNHPHNGVSIENSMNFSIGFQAPNNQELWSGFADKLIDENLGERRFPDKERTLTRQPEQLEQTDIEKLKAFMKAQLDDDKLFTPFIGKYLTQNHHALEILMPVTPIDSEQLADILAEAENTLVPVSGIKSLIVPFQHQDLQPNETSFLYINGESFLINKETITLATYLTKQQTLTTKKVKSLLTNLKNEQLLTNVLNMGFWYVE